MTKPIRSGINHGPHWLHLQSLVCWGCGQTTERIDRGGEWILCQMKAAPR